MTHFVLAIGATLLFLLVLRVLGKVEADIFEAPKRSAAPPSDDGD